MPMKMVPPIVMLSCLGFEPALINMVNYLPIVGVRREGDSASAANIPPRCAGVWRTALKRTMCVVKRIHVSPTFWAPFAVPLGRTLANASTPACPHSRDLIYSGLQGAGRLHHTPCMPSVNWSVSGTLYPPKRLPVTLFGRQGTTRRR